MKTLSKVVALVLSVVLLMSSIPMMTFGLGVDESLKPGTATGTDGYYNVISRKDWVLVPDAATETELVLNNATGTRRQVLHVIEVDPSNPDVSIIPGYNQIDKDLTDEANWSHAVLTDMAAYYEKNLGYNIVGGMNTDLYYDTYAPRILVYNGKSIGIKGSYAPSSSILYVFQEEDGTVSCDVKAYSKTDFDAYLASGRLLHAVSVSFGMVVKDGELVNKTVKRGNDDAARSMVGIKEDGTLVICMNDGRSANNSVGLSSYEEGEIMLSLGCQWAANCDGGGSSTFLTKRVGEETFTMRSVPCDGAPRATAHGIFVTSNVAPTGVLDVVNVESDYDYFAPKTTYTFGAEAIDTHGYAMDMPADAAWVLSDASFGTIENGVFVSNGKLGTVDVQIVSGGAVVGSKTITVANPTTLKLSATSTVVPYSTTEKVREITMPIVAQIGEANVYYDTNAVSVTLSDENAGTLDGFKFTATSDMTVTGVNVTMTYIPTGAELVYAIEFGKGSEVIYDFEDGDRAGFMGFEEAKKWSIDNGVNNTLVGSDPLAGQFNPYLSSNTFVTTATDGGEVRNGDYALAWRLDNTDASFANWSYNVLFNTGDPLVLRDVANDMKATTLGMWVYIPEGAPGLAFQSQLYVKNADGSYTCKQDHFMFETVSGVRKNLNSCTEADIPESRWVYASIDISKYDYLCMPVATDESQSRSPSFLRTYVKPTMPAELTFYIDDITLDYSSAVDDRVLPTITAPTYSTADTAITLENSTAINGDKAAFSATVADNVAVDAATAKVYVDGAEVKAAVSGNYLSTDDIALVPGVHNVLFEIKDEMGNRAQLYRTFTVTGDAVVALSGHNDSGETPKAQSIYYVDINVNDVTNVNKLVASLKLQNANVWETAGAVVADGFKATFDYNEVSEVLTVAVEAVDEAKTAGQTLVSIPVRVWTFDRYNYVTNTYYAVSEMGNKPVVNIDCEVAYGEMTFADDTTASFGGVINVATELATISSPYHEHDAELTVLNAEATCTKNGYENRTYCATCASVVDWGTVIEATGHSYGFVENVLKCVNDDCDVTFTGTWTDGKDYVDGATVADGWHGDYYYVNGVKLTGLQNIDGVYYNFDENGKSQGKTNGLITVDGVNYCTIAGNLVNGWQLIENEYYYFDPITNAGINGVRSSLEVCNTSQKFEYSFTNGKLDDGVWLEMAEGTRYYYGSGHYGQGTYVIDGKTYGFNSKGYRYEGFCVIRWNPKSNYQLFEYTADGVYVGEAYDSGVYTTTDGSIYYLTNGVASAPGLVNYEGDYYFFGHGYMTARTNGTYNIAEANTNGLLPAGGYTFGADGKMLQGIVTDANGKIRYYVNGNPSYAGLVKDDNGDFYYFSGSTMAAVTNGAYSVSKTNGLLATGTYYFGADGKMLQGLLTDANGNIRYYVNGRPTYAGLVQDANGDYYYISGSAMNAIVNTTRYISFTNDLLPAGTYAFGADGKMLQGVVTGADGKIRYYVNGQPSYAGLVQDANGDYYYFSGSTMTAIVNTSYNVSKTNGLLATGVYTFGADGKMLQGIVKGADGKVRYYVNGKATYAGLIRDTDGSYYYISGSTLTAVTNSTRYISFTNGLVPNGTYSFGADGKMTTKQGVVKCADGKIRYYEQDVAVYAGLVRDTDGSYYYISGSTLTAITNTTRHITFTNGLLPAGTYTFGADGKMILD